MIPADPRQGSPRLASNGAGLPREARGRVGPHDNGPNAGGGMRRFEAAS
jgi:hypothetical protein